MDDDDGPSCTYVGSVHFGVYTSKESLQMSVKEVVNPLTFDILDHPSVGGLYDPVFGSTEMGELCTTCGGNSVSCEGHQGHIVLPLPCYHPMFFDQLVMLLRCSCHMCHQFLGSFDTSTLVTEGCLRLLEAGVYVRQEELSEAVGATREVIGAGEDMTGEEELGGVAYDPTRVKERMEEYISSAIKESQQAGDRGTWLRHHEAAREKLRLALMEEILKGRKRANCQHCGAPNSAKSLRTEYSSRIFVQKQASSGVKKKKTPRKKKADPADGVEEEQEQVRVLDREIGAEELERFCNRSYLSPQDAKGHLKALWANEASVLRALFGMLKVPVSEAASEGQGHGVANDSDDLSGGARLDRHHPTDIFFLEVVAVPPNRFRPARVMKGQKFEHPQTANLRRVLEDCINMRELVGPSPGQDQVNGAVDRTLQVPQLKDSGEAAKFHHAWLLLQTHINCLYDSRLDRLSQDKQPGIKQILEKKEGIFRMHMMGKRVNYASRSVISPDPYISVHEIGIPEVFAKKLTYPEFVTPWNVEEMREAVINGPDVHPGACFVVTEKGRKILLSKDERQREALAKSLLTDTSGETSSLLPPKKVYRHLRNGDFLLLNRQPTLHRPSIQAHQARVLKGEKTIRLHYACCKAYNADFDGDEMNAHFPQNELGRAEALTLVSTPQQYLVPKDGTPLAGLIQDHIVSGVLLTIRGNFFDRSDYHHLVYNGLVSEPRSIQLLPPAIVRPTQLWSGKQIVSTIIQNVIPEGRAPLNMQSKAKIRAETWLNAKVRGHFSKAGRFDPMDESSVIIRGGELMCGVLDKSNYGNTAYGLVHCCYELYGGRVASALLSSLGRLFTAYLQLRGFTLGIKDILVTKKADKSRRRTMEEAKLKGAGVAGQVLNVEEEEGKDALTHKFAQAQFGPTDARLRDLDKEMGSMTAQVSNDISKACLAEGLLVKFPVNNLELLITAGAKGSMVNMLQITSLLGQIELEGKRPPLMASGRCLPSFAPYDTSPRAGGFVDNRFVSGVKPQEYFFHCMAGREGLVDTAVKTATSGYLQRCIIKHLEGISVNYDLTVRESDGSVVQFQYGEDSLEISRTPFLNQSRLPFLLDNHKAALDEKQLARAHSMMDVSKADKRAKKMAKKAEETVSKKRRMSPFLAFCAERPTDAASARTGNKTGRAKSVQKLIEEYRRLEDKALRKLVKRTATMPDPINCCLTPCKHFGSMSEVKAKCLSDFVTSNPKGVISTGDSKVGSADSEAVSADKVRDIFQLRHLQSLVQPGEAVGVLAGQSIGEPSTQMTLNTFHHAGRGEMNVTLGIPRLIEILVVASSKIKTPMMTVPLLPGKHAQRRCQSLQRMLNRVVFGEVIHKIEVTKTFDALRKAVVCTVKMSFLPSTTYSSRTLLTPNLILEFVERHFINDLVKLISKAYKRATSTV